MSTLTIRLPESLHDQVRQLADEEGISMNQFVMLAVAEKVTRLDEGQSLAYLDALEQVGKTLAEEGRRCRRPPGLFWTALKMKSLRRKISSRSTCPPRQHEVEQAGALIRHSPWKSNQGTFGGPRQKSNDGRS
mgnify:CR=1 FL=1